tara:strand:+ start:292 stop:705 length:414 start_codon:yes stop_codon:yes gene_type:complete
MIQSLFDNIPSINNKKDIKNKSNFNNLEKQKVEQFDANLSNLFKTNLNYNNIHFPTNKKTDITIETDNKNQFQILSALDNINFNIFENDEDDQDSDNDEEVNDEIRMHKLDFPSTIYITSISIIGLYIAYKAIKKTI